MIDILNLWLITYNLTSIRLIWLIYNTFVCKGDLVYYHGLDGGEGTKGGMPCTSDCENKNNFGTGWLNTCGLGCSCPKDTVKHPHIWYYPNKCIKPEECPPLGKFILQLRAYRVIWNMPYLLLSFISIWISFTSRLWI